MPNDLYSLKGGCPNESYCIEHIDNKWVVYYSERDLKRTIGFYYNEEDACKAFINEINTIVGE